MLPIKGSLVFVRAHEELKALLPAESGCILSLFLINIGVSCNLSPRVQHSLSVSVLLAFICVLRSCAHSLFSGSKSK